MYNKHAHTLSLQVASLSTTIDAATAEWEELAPTTDYSVMPTPVRRCRRCGGNQRGVVEWRKDRWLPSPVFSYADLMPRAFCTTCHPQLRALIDQHVPELDRLAALARERQVRFTQRRRQHDAIMATLRSIGWRLSRSTFRQFIPDTETSAVALQQVRTWASDPAARSRCPVVLLSGPPGLGKSHLAVATFKRIAHRDEVPVFISEAELNRQWRRANDAAFAETDYDGPSVDDLVDGVKSARTLIVDDLGKVRLTEAWERVLFEVFDYRDRHGLPTLVTSNHGPQTLAQFVGGPIADRAMGGVVLEVTGASKRGMVA